MKNILVFILLLCITSPAVGQRVKKSHEDIAFVAELIHQAYEEEAREILDSLLSVDYNNSDAAIWIRNRGGYGLKFSLWDDDVDSSNEYKTTQTFDEAPF